MTVTEGILQHALPQAVGVYGGRTYKLSKKTNHRARYIRGEEFPLVLQAEFPVDPSEDKSVYSEFAAFVEELAEKHDFFKTLIRKHGALVIQGFGSGCPKRFAVFIGSVAKGSQWIPYEQNGVAHPRITIAENVTTVNKSTGLSRLYAHQEFSRFKRYPSVLTFFAKEPSETGGHETITHATELFDKLVEKYPEFIEQMVKKGVYLTQTWPYEQKLANGSVYSWKATHSFGSLIEEDDDLEKQKAKAGLICKEYVVDEFEFTKDNGLKLHEHTQPVRKDPYSGNPILFSSLPGYYAKYKLDLEKNGSSAEPAITYDDGSLIPLEYLDYLLEQSIECCYEHPFQKGDIVFINNYTCYHGRTPYGTQNREILASFWDDAPEYKITPSELRYGADHV
ncbi:hypothetical protein KL935_003164 [Ogataea polymorpha]|nr:hypothetical protein KL935_003164 [Ogataea polymorpha]